MSLSLIARINPTLHTENTSTSFTLSLYPATIFAMGLVRLAVIGGAGAWAVNRYRRNQSKTQNVQQQQPQQQYRDHTYQPDYYNLNTFRNADDDMYGPPTEKRQHSQYATRPQPPQEKPMQLNFVAPSERVQAQWAGSNAGKY